MSLARYDDEEMVSLVDSTKIVVNVGQDDEFRVKSYRRNILCTVVFYIAGFLSAGVVFLLGYWYPVKRLKSTHDKCSFKDGTTLLIRQSIGKQEFVTNIHKQNVTMFKSDQSESCLQYFEKQVLSERYFIYFEHMFLRYYFDKDFTAAYELSGLDNLLSEDELHKMSTGLTTSVFNLKQYIHKKNVIDVPDKSYLVVFLQLAMNPFYVFQVFSCTLWYNDNYYYYATIILLMTLASLIATTIETKQQMKKLRKMIGEASRVNVIRNEKTVEILSHDLVPGDVIVIPETGLDVPCDAVLINGTCIVNESTLTGESFPNTKTSIDKLTDKEGVSVLYSVNKHKQHTLFNGTKVLEAHQYDGDHKVLAVVVRTGFCTLKGRLIRSIIHPKPIHFTFFRDSLLFIAVFAMIAFIGFIYTLVLFIRDGAPAGKVIRKSLDLFTIAIPPALPACMSVGIMSALRHLKSQNIFSIDPSRINFCGKIKLVVFDKTGTLTEDELSVGGVLATCKRSLTGLLSAKDIIAWTDIFQAMSCCHGLHVIDGEVSGDPLDHCMFDFTGSELLKQTRDEKDGTDGSYMQVKSEHFGSIPLCKQYIFESSLQRMSVVIRQNEQYLAYTKGSPEKILSLCNSESIPEQIRDTLSLYSHQGLRLLAIATKVLPDDMTPEVLRSLPRGDVECDLQFLGLIVFENGIKSATIPTIATLQDASIRCVMATGDNLLTASRVAREVNIIKSHQPSYELFVQDDVLRSRKLDSEVVKLVQDEDELELKHDTFSEFYYSQGLNYSLVMTGDTYEHIRRKGGDTLETVLLSSSVFARMSPDQKANLIEDFKAIGYGVAMCGDGANDCGGLKAAHAGIALSDTEASVAAPFTSKTFDISCVPKLISEGRAALVTSFDTFKYMVAYSFIQFFGVVILYHVNSNYSDFGFLYADLFLNMPLVFAMIQSKPNPVLVAKRPNGRLIHPIFVGGVFLQLLIQLAFQVAAFMYVRKMAWYKAPVTFEQNKNEELYFYAYENSAVMTISFFQYIWCSVVIISGLPYRLPFYKNIIYVVTLVLTIILTAYITLYPAPFVTKWLEWQKLPSIEFILSLLALSLGNLFLSFVVEKYLLPSNIMRKFSNFLRRKKTVRNRYKHVFMSLHRNKQWPPPLS